jgi:hypothetical protein
MKSQGLIPGKAKRASGLVLELTQLPFQYAPGDLERLNHRRDHSPPSFTGAKNVRSYTSIPQYVFVSYLIKYRRNFSFLSSWYSGNYFWGKNGPLKVKIKKTQLSDITYFQTKV